jgi:hypothetical protein
MEHGELSREAFMREIAEMTEHIVKKAKEFDRDTIPGDYTTLNNSLPHMWRCGEGKLPPVWMYWQGCFGGRQ